MTDPFLTRDWSDQHARFSDSVFAAIADVWGVVRVSLDRLNRYEFDAPWHHDRCAER